MYLLKISKIKARVSKIKNGISKICFKILNKISERFFVFRENDLDVIQEKLDKTTAYFSSKNEIH